MQRAAPVALIAVSAGAAVGAFEGFRHHLVRYRAAILIAVAGAGSTWLGLIGAQLLSQKLLLLLFSAVMILVAVRMYLQTKRNQVGDDNSRWTIGNLSSLFQKFVHVFSGHQL